MWFLLGWLGLHNFLDAADIYIIVERSSVTTAMIEIRVTKANNKNKCKKKGTGDHNENLSSSSFHACIPLATISHSAPLVCGHGRRGNGGRG